MMMNNYSQLPVVDNKHKDEEDKKENQILSFHTKGYVSWKNIGAILHKHSKKSSEFFEKKFVKVNFCNSLTAVKKLLNPAFELKMIDFCLPILYKNFTIT
jgi:hypothetical protein